MPALDVPLGRATGLLVAVLGLACTSPRDLPPTPGPAPLADAAPGVSPPPVLGDAGGKADAAPAATGSPDGATGSDTAPPSSGTEAGARDGAAPTESGPAVRMDAPPPPDAPIAPDAGGCSAVLCPKPEHATAMCLEERCVWTCEAGFAACDGSCLATTEMSCCHADRTVDVDQNGVADCSENLLPNGQFDKDVVTWSAAENDKAEWSAMDAAGRSNSGSLKATNGSPMQPFFVGGGAISVCIPAASSAGYRVRVDYFIPAGQEPLASAFLQVLWNDNTDCTSGVGGGSGYVDLGVIRGAWTSVTRDLTSPAGTQSVNVTLDGFKGEALPFVVHFDNVLFKRL